MNDGIFSLIPEERIQDILQTLHSYTGLKVQLIGSDGQELCAFGERTAYCSTLNDHLFPAETCAKLHANAGSKAKSLGEAYVFTCHADLNHIAFPLLSRGELFGTIIVGPFLMDTPDSTFVGTLIEKHPVSPMLALILNSQLDKVPVIVPLRVNHLKKLLDHLLSPLMPSAHQLLLEEQQKAYQQARINETIQIYKDEASPTDGRCYYEKEAILLDRVRAGDTNGAREALDNLIAQVFYTDGASADSLCMHSHSILAALATAVVRGGASADLIYKLHRHYYPKMKNESTADGLSFLLQEALESFMGEMLGINDNGNIYVRSALRYMAENYNCPLTLETVAEAVFLSPNYFSTLFRKTVGVSFRHHLCRIRVEESKRLLLSTDYSLTDIAIAMGFNDQSYYCKVFKRITGLTPGQYRYRG